MENFWTAWEVFITFFWNFHKLFKFFCIVGDKANSTEDAKKYFFKINELLRKQERYREQIDDIIRNFNERKNEQKRSRDRLAQYEQDLVNYTNELQNCTSDADRLDAQVVDAKKELDELNEQRDSVM